MAASRYEIKIRSSKRLPAIIAEASGLSISEVKQAMHKGAVWISDGKGTRRIRRATKKTEPGATIHFYHDPGVLAQQAEAPVLLADEGNYSIWIKPRGVLAHGSKWGDHCSITRLVENIDNKNRPAFLIHRLDRAATGLIIIGHGRKATRLFAAMFANRQIRKTYHTVVMGQFAQPRNIITFTDDIEGRRALTQVRLLDCDVINNRTLVEVIIDSGRKHQIRKHLSQAGQPVVGDRLYGGGADRDLQLAAVSLGFQCPISGIEKFFELPEDFRPHL